MRIGFNGLRLSGQPFGIGRYIEYLLKHWRTMLEPSERVVVYVRRAEDAAWLGLTDPFEVRPLPSRWGGVLWEHLSLAPRWRETDVLFCPSYTVPLNYRGRLVVATHSVNEAQKGAHTWWYHLTYRPRNQLCARKADAVIVPSESTRRQVADFYGVRPERITVVAEGVDDAFRPVEDEQVLRETRERFFGEDRPYVLFVGKMSERRSPLELVEAFAAVKRKLGLPHGLLLYGPNVENLPLDSLADSLGVADSVVQLNERLEQHTDILPVYSAADVFVHPSRYEGFSLTTCEAMACGTPVITVNRGAAREIADGAAILVDEPNPSQLGDALERVLADAAFRASLGERARERAKRFRLEDTARGTLEVLRRVAAEA